MPEFGSYPEKVSPAAGDFLLVLDGDDDATKKVDVGNLPAGSGGGPVELVLIDATSDEMLLFEQGSSQVSGTVGFFAFLDPTPHITPPYARNSPQDQVIAVWYQAFRPRIVFSFTDVADPESDVQTSLYWPTVMAWMGDVLRDAVGAHPTIPGYTNQDGFLYVNEWEYDWDFNRWYLSPSGDQVIFDGHDVYTNEIVFPLVYLPDPLEEGGSLDWWRSHAHFNVIYVEDA